MCYVPDKDTIYPLFHVFVNRQRLLIQTNLLMCGSGVFAIVSLWFFLIIIFVLLQFS